MRHMESGHYLCVGITVIDYTLGIVIFGTTILGVTAGAMGVFALLRRQSLLGDAIAHAAFPGIVTAFLLTHSKDPALLMVGGSIAGCIGALTVTMITHYSSLKKDAALGIVLSVFFGLGLVLMTITQKKPLASQAVLNKFLFGNASTLLLEDVLIMACVGLAVIASMIFLKKEFVLVAFDSTYARAMGYPVLVLDSLLTLLLVLAICIGLQTVGVVLMSTMLIAPAAAARQWTYRLTPMISIAALCGAIAGMSGSIISSMFERMPTGPVIVVILSALVLFSLVCARIIKRTFQ